MSITNSRRLPPVSQQGGYKCPLLKLAAQCEAAREPSDILDTTIDETVRGAKPAPDGGRWNTTPHYSSSVDAALTLVPEDEFICLDGPRKYLNIPTPVPNYWRCCIGYAPEHFGWAATLALAICAAALRARAAKK